MAEESAATTEVVQTGNTDDSQRQQAFQEAIWGKTEDTQSNAATTTETKAEENNNVVNETSQVEIKTETTNEEEILDPKDWLKRELDIDDISVLKAEREEFKKLKEQKPEETKWANEESKQIVELLKAGKKKEALEIVAMQDKIESLIGLDVNEDTAPDIIKTGLKLKYPSLTDKEIEHKYNKQYSLPKEPVQGSMEDDDDFQSRKAEWEEKVNDIKMDRILDAKTMKPDLEKAKKELVFPEIEKDNTATKNALTPEELEVFEKAKTSFLQSAKQTIDGFNGFNVQVKDKDVDFAVNYTPSPDEKKMLSDSLSKLADSGFDANALFADRWYDVKNQSFNVEQMTKDLSRMLMGENADQKLAMDSANKRMEAFLAEKKNVRVTEGNRNSTFAPQKITQSEKIAEHFWGG